MYPSKNQMNPKKCRMLETFPKEKELDGDTCMDE
jgi:hypothetical protein